MKIAHTITIKVFVKKEENKEEIKRVLQKLILLDLEKEKIKVVETTADGFEDKKIEILEIVLTKENHTTKFLEKFKSELTEQQKKMLLDQIDSRLDDECNFFIRLDKEKLLSGQKEITDSGNCYHLKITVAAYPTKKETAKQIMQNFLIK